MKVAIIGASGHVGRASTLTLAEEDSIKELVLVSRESSFRAIEGEAMDLYDALAAKDVHISIKTTCNMEDIASSDIILLAAGTPRKEGMSRSDLAIPNAHIIADYSKSIAKYAPNSIILVVSNPVDVMTYVALKASGFNKNKVLGLGNHLDSLRLKNLISKHFNINVSEVRSRVIGEHGDHMVPLINSTTIGGLPLDSMSNYNDFDINKIIDKVKNAGNEIIGRKGATEYGPAYAVYNLVSTILNDEKKILTVSTYLGSEFEIDDVCLGVPVKLGENGIEEIIPVDLSHEEKIAFSKAANSVKELTNIVMESFELDSK